MTAQHIAHDDPLIPMPALTLPALRQALAAVAPSRLPQFFEEMQDAFTRAGEEESVIPIRMFYRRWGVTVAIERDPAIGGTPARGRERPRPRRPRGQSACDP